MTKGRFDTPNHSRNMGLTHAPPLTPGDVPAKKSRKVRKALTLGEWTRREQAKAARLGRKRAKSKRKRVTKKRRRR